MTDLDDAHRFLEPGENLLWHGRPDVNRLVRKQYGWCFFAGAFLALSLLWAWSTAQEGTAVSLFVALLFVLAGLGVAAAKLRDIMAARTTRYLVTDRRAITLSGRNEPRVDSVAGDEIGPVTVTNVKDGLGDVLFHERPRFLDLRGVKIESSGFIGLADPAAARAALQQIARRESAHHE